MLRSKVSRGKMFRKSTALAVFMLIGAAGAYAQVAAGLAAISGRVQDGSGGAIPGAKVVVSNDAKGLHRNLETNEAGLFSAPGLTPAAGYSVTINASGFSQ